MTFGVLDWWGQLHRRGANLLKRILNWLPFSESFTDVVISLFVFTDISQERKDEFQQFYVDVLTELLHLWLWWHAIVLVLSWPLEFFLFSRELLLSYAIWRCAQLVLIVFALLDFNSWGYLKQNVDFTYFFLTSIVILITGFSFGRVVSISSQWFNVIYALPFLCLIPHLRFGSRLLSAFYFPFLYMGSFIALNPIQWQFEILRNTSFILFYDCILVGSVTHLFFNMFKNSFFVQRKLEEERQRSEELLLNILPEEVAGELKESNRRIAHGYDDATVLFADIVDFTPLAEELKPASVVTLLDDIVRSFDRIVEDYPVEKIKTIGDEYFLIAGVPNPIDNHAVVAASVAVEMVNEVQSYRRKGDESFDISIGLNSGPVVAGVIGTDKFVFDCWGDTVNVGSRMESHSEPGKIQITASTKKAIEDQDNENQFEFESRGKIEVKGKGLMETYFLSKKDSADAQTKAES
ncbi:MAG: adenylate/guanylate cyclase domain-containing protein [bacterium]